jgi:hypothetical protein
LTVKNGADIKIYYQQLKWLKLKLNAIIKFKITSTIGCDNIDKIILQRSLFTFEWVDIRWYYIDVVMQCLLYRGLMWDLLWLVRWYSRHLNLMFHGTRWELKLQKIHCGWIGGGSASESIELLVEFGDWICIAKCHNIGIVSYVL